MYTIKSICEELGISEGQDTFHTVIMLGKEDMARWFAENHQDVNAFDSKGTTPLCYAANFGHPGIVSMLLTNGADVNLLSTAGLAPLHYAASAGSRKCAEILVSEGADLGAKSPSRETPEQCAARNKHTDIEQILGVTRYFASEEQAPAVASDVIGDVSRESDSE